MNETIKGMCVYLLRNTSCLLHLGRRSAHALPVKLQILSKVVTLPNLITPFSSKWSCFYQDKAGLINTLNLIYSIENFEHSKLVKCGKSKRNKWDLMMSRPASLTVISFIKNWHKKLRLLVDLRIFSKFQGANSHKNEGIKISCQYA